MSRARTAIIAIFVLACVAPAGGCKARLADPQRARTLQWGEPVDGLQAGLAVNHYRPGKKAWLSVTYAIRNVGETPLRIVSLPHYTGSSRYYPTRGPLEVRGAPRPWLAPLEEAPTPETAYELLEPGAQATLTGGIDPGHYRLGGTFDAQLTFVYEVDQPPGGEVTEGAVPPWIGRARSAPVRAQVRY